MIGEYHFAHKVAGLGVEDANLVWLNSPCGDGDEVGVPDELTRVSNLDRDDADPWPWGARQFAIEADAEPHPDAPSGEPTAEFEPLHDPDALRSRRLLQRSNAQESRIGD